MEKELQNDPLQKTETGLILWTTGHKSCVLIDGISMILGIPGKWKLNRRGKKPIAPGDLVKVIDSDYGWQLVEPLPRRNEYTRRAPGSIQMRPQVIAANIDLVVVIGAVAEPRTATGLIDRLLVTAELGQIETALVLNKIDLISPAEIEAWQELYQHAVSQIIFTSAVDRIGIHELESLIRGQTVLFAGASGVGKSSLVNCIDPTLNIKTRDVSTATGKGKHTTSAAKLHAMLGDGWLIDTPGIRECGPWGKTPHNLVRAFPEMRELDGECQFRNCLHRGEKGCAMAEIINTEKFPQERYRNYLKLLDEAIEEQRPEYLTKE